MAKPPLEPPPYTNPPPEGSMRGKPYPSEREFGGGDSYYGAMWRYDQDNGMGDVEYNSPEYNRRVNEAERSRIDGGTDNPFARIGQTIRSQMDRMGPMNPEQRKAFVDQQVGMVREQILTSAEDQLRGVYDSVYADFPDEAGMLDSMSMEEQAPGQTGDNKLTMMLNQARDVPGGADIARRSGQELMGRMKNMRIGLDQAKLSPPARDRMIEQLQGAQDFRRDAELLANARRNPPGLIGGSKR